MTDEYIRKADAVEAIGEEYVPRTDFERGMVSQLSCDKGKIKALPSADVAPVVHGRWINEWWHGETTRKCSVCNITQTVNVYEGNIKFNYCPYCGARMDGGKNI